MNYPFANLNRRQFSLGTAAFVAAPAVRAQSNRTVRMVVPFPPGGSTDILGRAIAVRLASQMGVNVIVENRPGAGGSVGATEVAKAAPDGNTLLMGHIGTLAVNPSIYPNLAYDPIKSFTPLAWVANVPNVLVVNAQSPAKDLKAFIAQAKANPGRLTHSSGGNGSAAHIAFEYLKQQAKFFMLHIPYRGTAPSINDLMAGQVDATFTGSPAVLTHIRSGRLRALAVSSAKRIDTLPDVPTVAESGFPGFDADQWYGVVGPAGMSPDLVALYNAEINKALTSPEVARSMANEGAVPKPSAPQAFRELIVREIPRWAVVVKAGNVTAG